MTKNFLEMIELRQKGKCPFCSKKVFLEDFKNKLSIKEYQISGICMRCQNETFR